MKILTCDICDNHEKLPVKTYIISDSFIGEKIDYIFPIHTDGIKWKSPKEMEMCDKCVKLVEDRFKLFLKNNCLVK